MSHYLIELVVFMLLAYGLGCLVGWVIRNLRGGEPAAAVTAKPVVTAPAPTPAPVMAKPTVVVPAPAPVIPAAPMPVVAAPAPTVVRPAPAM